ncbi:MAG TPA: winged helix-turn-helix domain-containing protein [Pyrinomonadaceae bacterium]|nr:winged helix-turn-helix domain-containing protein [Pyrinomonadaceae bacterium]
MSGQNIHLYEFGEFQININERFLLHNNQHIRLSPKTFELLSFLVRRNNQIIEKGTLMRDIWQDTFVEEANLTVHISVVAQSKERASSLL